MMPKAPFDPLPDDKDRAGSIGELADAAESSEAPQSRNEYTGVRARAQYRGAGDPLFGFIIATALSVGLTPLLPESVELRYTLAWGALAGVSVLSWLLGSMERIGQERPDNLGWGVLYGILLGIPFLVFLSQHVLGPATSRLFPGMSTGSLLAFSGISSCRWLRRCFSADCCRASSCLGWWGCWRRCGISCFSFP